MLPGNFVSRQDQCIACKLAGYNDACNVCIHIWVDQKLILNTTNQFWLIIKFCHSMYADKYVRQSLLLVRRHTGIELV